MKPKQEQDLEIQREAPNMYVFEYPYARPPRPPTSHKTKADVTFMSKFKAEGYMVNKQSIHGWISQKDQIMEGSITRKRLEGGGRKTILGPEFEDIIIGMINDERAEGNRVTGSQVQDWAMQIAVENGIDKFKASDGWLNSFLERNGYSFRRITNLTALSSDELN
jgi:hypothetical protein